MKQFNVYLDGKYQFTTVGESEESVLNEVRSSYGGDSICSRDILTGRIFLEQSPISFNYTVIPTSLDHYDGDLILDYIVEDGDISQTYSQ